MKFDATINTGQVLTIISLVCTLIGVFVISERDKTTMRMNIAHMGENMKTMGETVDTLRRTVTDQAIAQARILERLDRSDRNGGGGQFDRR